MRDLLTFRGPDATLAATLDGEAGDVGLLMVTGGTQTRIGSHRMYERLAASLAVAGHPCFRFDRRGVGDSEGADPGFRGAGDDLRAAAAAFRTRLPQLRRIIGFGLCDGATSLMLFGGAIGLDGLILVNPWLVESEAGTPPPAAVRRRYRDQLTSLDGWRRLLTGRVSFRKLAGGLRRAAAPPRSSLGGEAVSALDASGLPVRLILARNDATSIAAEQVLRSGRLPPTNFVESDSHTFARPGDTEALRSAVLRALSDLNSEGR